MKLLFTGASGFLGNNVLPFLENRYEIKTVGMTEHDDYCVDIAKEELLLEERYEIVLHAAGKAHTVPKTSEEEQAYFDVNYQGTVNLCKALEKSGIPGSFIFVSTVAVYGLDFGENITEEHPLNGKIPYALSKKYAEEFLVDWCGRHNVILSIIRPSLIVGPNPPGNLGDMIKGIKTGRYLSIGGGTARKSVLMVQDIANLVPILAEKGGVYNVCDSNQPTFRELDRVISSQLGKPLPPSIPYWMAKFLALVGDYLGEKAPINSFKLKKITKSLTFSNEKIKKELNWKPLDVIENFKIK